MLHLHPKTPAFVPAADWKSDGTQLRSPPVTLFLQNIPNCLRQVNEASHIFPVA